MIDKKDEMLTTLSDLRLFIWNPTTKEFCRRTGISWLKLLGFYIILYLFLAAFWSLMWLAFFQTIDPRAPKWQLDESRIGVNPGMSFKPQPSDDHSESNLIRFKPSANSDWNYWSESLDQFLKPYESSGIDYNAINCSRQNVTTNLQFCFFDIKLINENCTADQRFGYNRGSPCVLIKLNRIYNWLPEPFTESEISHQISLPADQRWMPDEVIRNYNPKKIYITCDGQSSSDRDNIGPINYYPDNGIEFKYFPFTNQPGYLSPFVFVHFAQLKMGVRITVECKAWARNVWHDRFNSEGSVRFDLLINEF